MKFTVALTIAIVSVAVAKPTPRNDPKSSEEATTITPSQYERYRRHTATATDTADIRTKVYEHHRRHTGTPTIATIATEESSSIPEDVRVTEHPAADRTRAAHVAATNMATEDVTGGEFVFTSGNSHATIEVVTVRP
ncbi:hypothetical protein ANCCAN_03221 [Ancylostoma caninum]|uniref:Uncharacterized protein n=1 Tax=Ancylostoma caninum TaxID=29170 RepID=A0A368H4B3_ANCCA|nr:hypothetical protein ANCCAN_03221 [Ancylostoma caninum]